MRGATWIGGVPFLNPGTRTGPLGGSLTSTTTYTFPATANGVFVVTMSVECLTALTMTYAYFTFVGATVLEGSGTLPINGNTWGAFALQYRIQLGASTNSFTMVTDAGLCTANWNLVVSRLS